LPLFPAVFLSDVLCIIVGFIFSAIDEQMQILVHMGEGVLMFLVHVRICSYMPQHEGVWGSGGIAACILNLGTRWR
jgi:hypothetical protein